MWQGLQSITDYKKKTSPVGEINVLLPDKLNNFFARFEDTREQIYSSWVLLSNRLNLTVPLTRPVGSPSPYPM